MLRKLAVSIATLIALSHSQVVQAEAWFEVEVYVFERQSQSSEQWPDAPNKTKTDNAIDLISPLSRKQSRRYPAHLRLAHWYLMPMQIATALKP